MGQDVIHWMTENTGMRVMQLLIEHGANVNARDRDQVTPLHQWSSTGNHKAVRQLIEHGADVNARDQAHSTPLHNASSVGILELSNYYSGTGRMCMHAGSTGGSTLHLCIWHRSGEVLRLLDYYSSKGRMSTLVI
jgi:hypothetical protein